MPAFSVERSPVDSHVAAVAGQLARILGHRVLDAVAVLEARHRPIGVVLHFGGEGAGLGRPA